MYDIDARWLTSKNPLELPTVRQIAVEAYLRSLATTASYALNSDKLDGYQADAFYLTGSPIATASYSLNSDKLDGYQADAFYLTGSPVATASYSLDSDKLDGQHSSYFEISGTADARVVTHENAFAHANIPTTNEKAALSGSSGTPSGTNKYVTDIDKRLDLGSDTDRRGFTSRTSTQISFDGTDEFTLADSGSGWSYYYSGSRCDITGDKTITVASPMVNNTMYYIYIDSTAGDLVTSTSVWTLADSKVPVATIYWNNTATPKYILADERHTCLIDSTMHRFEHFSEGTRLLSGGTIYGLTASSDTPAAKTFGISESKIADEDIFLTISALTDPDGNTPTYYNVFRTSPINWSWAISDMPFKYADLGGGTYGYVEYDNGSGTSTQASNNNFVNSYVVLSNAVSGSEVDSEVSNSPLRYFIVQGRGAYGTAALALGERFDSFDLTGFPVWEAVAIYQITWATTNRPNSVKGRCRYYSTQKITSNIVTTTANSVGTHNSLAGLQGGTSGEYYHLDSLLYASASSFFVSGGASKVSGSDGNVAVIDGSGLAQGFKDGGAPPVLASGFTATGRIVDLVPRLQTVAAGDANCTFGTNYYCIASHATLTAQRTDTLPDAAVYPGALVGIADDTTHASNNAGTFPIIIQSGGGTIDGRTEITISVRNGRLFFVSDGTNWHLIDGPSAWLPPGKVKCYADIPAAPVDADEFTGLTGQSRAGALTGWTGVNLTDVSATVLTNGEGCLVNYAGEANMLFGWVRAVPAASNWTIEGCVSPFGVLVDYWGAGLIVAQGTTVASNKVVCFGPAMSENAFRYWEAFWSADWNSFPIVDQYGAIQSSLPYWLRISYVYSTNTFTLSMSQDGIGWVVVQVYSPTAALPGTWTHYGFGGFAGAAPITGTALWRYWRRTA